MELFAKRSCKNLELHLELPGCFGSNKLGTSLEARPTPSVVPRAAPIAAASSGGGAGGKGGRVSELDVIVELVIVELVLVALVVVELELVLVELELVELELVELELVELELVELELVLVELELVDVELELVEVTPHVAQFQEISSLQSSQSQKSSF